MGSLENADRELAAITGRAPRPLPREVVLKEKRKEFAGNPAVVEMRAKEAKAIVNLARASVDLRKQAPARSVDCGLESQ